MTYEIPPDLAERIQAQVESGALGSEVDVLREAMDTLEKRQRGLQEIRQLTQEAEDDLEAGRVGPFDAEQTKRAVREQLRKARMDD